ncbi:MAG: HD domain-containing protein [Clostridia bacterium]|nr:HD domain-containing protein [Clostridia bacterium]
MSIDEGSLDCLRASLKGEMEEARYRHTLGVEREIRLLARYFLPQKENVAAAAALLHDVTKGWSKEMHLAFCEEKNLPLTEDEKDIPALLHAKTAAALIPQRYPSFATDEILSAVSKHTAADREMSLLDALLYIADFTEDGREYGSCQTVRKHLHDGMAQSSLPKHLLLQNVLLETYDASLAALVRLGRPIAVATENAKRALLENDRYFS